MAKVEVRSLYAYDGDKVSQETGHGNWGKSLTVQDQAEEADINTIVRRFGLTGQLPNNLRMPSYGDFDGISSYQEARNAVLAADDAFMRLPVDVRRRFDNDPGLLVEFMAHDENRAEAVKLGLIQEKSDGDVKREAVSDAAGKVGASA